ncbi:MAG TPA: transcriptional regulator [Firmicutes bacterium]|nr:transcriptional regulator [Bacillota bacterium]
MEFIRIGDKLINLRKINETVRRILQLRSKGLSQQEVASKLSLDRGFISRLESLGNVRRGGRIGIVAFPVKNKAELTALADRYGVEDRLILTNSERWQLIEGSSGVDFLHRVFTIIEQLRRCDIVLVFCSSKWCRLAAALLDNEVIMKEIGETPLSEDVYVDVAEISSLLDSIASAEEDKK